VTDKHVAIFLSPQKNDPVHGPFFVAAIANDLDATGEAIEMSSLPELWEQKFTERLLPISLVADLFKLELLPGIAHVALLESDMKEADPFYFGRTKITHNSLLCWKHEDGTYRYFHCEKCAASVLVWITENQEAWSRPLN
jgi:hypothetical protein